MTQAPLRVLPPSPFREGSLTVAVVDPTRARAAVVAEGLKAAGIGKVHIVEDPGVALQRLAEIDPDVIVIDLENPSRDLLEQMFALSRVIERPVAMFVDQSDLSMSQAAVDAGVSAYVVDGLKPERVKSVVDIAILRFNAFARLQRELAEAKNELAERKVIERAKGILMRVKGVDEDDAYRMLRRKAMDEKRKLAEIAHAVVTASEILG